MSFMIGDRVRIVEPDDVASPCKTRADGLWLVTDEDTGKTPIHDPEPAYRLTPALGEWAGHYVRYAYASVMHPA